MSRMTSTEPDSEYFGAACKQALVQDTHGRCIWHFGLSKALANPSSSTESYIGSTICQVTT